MVHKMMIDGKMVKLEIWDTAGQERYVKKYPYLLSIYYIYICIYI